MKKLLTLYLILISFAASAQLSIIGGLNYSNLREGWDVDQKHKFGFRTGLEIKVNHFIFETVYTRKGLMQNRNQDPSTGAFAHDRWSFNMNYLQQSILYSVGKGWFTAQAGGYAAYLINAYQSNTFWGVYKRYTRDDFHPIDYGLVGRASIDLQGAFLTASYEKGLPYIADDGKPHGDKPNHHAYKNDAWTLGISVPLTK